ncbi:long-chain fatty acid transport protein 6 isoform X1 [Carcharodon carcharias]|uniref:long-chain fatty acid transport protein 6 isoform X1 n=1 Tax=Carcharodon carcharias TaxID=13397 RepID=UPI001B7F661E|nr:long-chain fatty acid transport protein 6 isoform X1 [Carcharodon carcharias]
MLLSVAAAAVAGAIALLFLLNLTFSCLCEDVRFVLRASKFGLKLMKIYLTKRVLTVLDRFAQRVEANPHKTFLLFEGRPYTYRAVDSRSNRVAQVFLQQQPGLRAGDTVALLMNNEPDFVCVWFGLSKLGCAVAFLNTNLRTRSLLHCLVSSGAKTLVVGADLVDIVEDILTDIQNNNISVWVMGKSCTLHEVNTLADKVEEAPDSPVPGSWKSAIYLKSTFLYIFTSGTTGLPKAAVITQLQSLRASAGFWVFGVTKEDIIYVPLPLYHGAASLLGICGCIEIGATLVLKKKFSASQFWNDCRKYNVTVVQYIGELCRYLCNQPKIEGEKNHQVRMAVGNGIRTEVWKEFLERFGNIKMCEFYGATEGNIFFMNYTGKLGAVGRTSYLYKAFLSYRLVKYDAQKETPIRNEQGRCEKVGKGETGLLISPVTKLNPFSGYAGSKKFSQQKLLEDVFKKGDLYFNTGDLMSESQDGYIYFRDRIGDTFRWKGENVATTEVAEIIGMMDFVEEANVYGVAIKGYEGRIGMAAIILKPVQEFDGKKLYDHVVKYLPSYAYPRFLRIQESMEMTGTFKRKKINLVEEAFNPMIITEPLYFLDPSVKSYILMTEQIYNQILSLKIKL